MNKEEVLKLAQLARIQMGEEEAEALSHDFEAILKYVGELRRSDVSEVGVPTGASGIKNVMREDANPHEAGIYTEALLAEAPAREKSFVKVKKIL